MWKHLWTSKIENTNIWRCENVLFVKKSKGGCDSGTVQSGCSAATVSWWRRPWHRSLASKFLWLRCQERHFFSKALILGPNSLSSSFSSWLYTSLHTCRIWKITTYFLLLTALVAVISPWCDSMCMEAQEPQCCSKQSTQIMQQGTTEHNQALGFTKATYKIKIFKINSLSQHFSF